MLSNNLLSGLKAFKSGIITTRNIGILAPCLAKASDPIQQLFLDKVREYKQKSSGGKLVDATPDIEREMKAELEKLAVIFGATGKTDMTQFPSFKYNDPHIVVQQAEAVAK